MTERAVFTVSSKSERKPKAPAAPAVLKRGGKRLWNSILRGVTLGPDELEVLRTSCQLRDRIDRLIVEIDKSASIVVGDRGSVQIDPRIPEIRRCEVELAKHLARLGVEIGSGWDGLTASERGRRAAMARWNR